MNDKVDWEGLKALEAKSSASFFPQDHINLHSAILGAWPQILAEHERSQQVIAAADGLMKAAYVADSELCYAQSGAYSGNRADVIDTLQSAMETFVKAKQS